jgi:mannose-1-phosphate guanylyltransferase/phosphomannomutase
MKCAIVAGGLGTRLRSIVGDIPKPMVPLDGVPLLERLIGLCRRFGIDDVHLLLGYRPEVIRDYFRDGSAFGVRLTYWIEPQPMGTAGCMRQIISALEGEDVLVLYGDVFVDMDLKRLIDFHRHHQPAATLVVHPNDHPHDSDLIETDGDRIIAFHNKPHPEGAYYSNMVNAGVYVLTLRLLQRIPAGWARDFGRDIFPEAVAAGEFLAAYNTPEYIKDIGTPERYHQVERDIRAGKPERCNLLHSRKAIFLDRDGTVNVWVPLLSRTEDMELYPGAAQAIRAANRSEYLAVLTTNQPQVARGLVTAAQLEGIHKKLETLLAREGAKLDAIYYCPHHPDRGYPEEVPELKIQCRCRKPDTLLFELAAERFNIDLQGSAVVGDSVRDLRSARRLGCRAVLVQTGLKGSDVPADLRPDYTARDLGDAVRWIVGVES